MTGDFEGFGSSLKGVEVFQHSSAPSWSLLIAFSGILLCLTVDTDRKYGGAGERYACARGKTSNLENITYGMCHINTGCSVHSFCVLSLTGGLTAKVGFVLPYFLGNVLDLLLRTAQKKKKRLMESQMSQRSCLNLLWSDILPRGFGSREKDEKLKGPPKLFGFIFKRP